MKDQLEDFIRKNRNAFDDHEPSEKNWKQIDASLAFTRKGIWHSVTVWRAAAVVFMLLSGYLLLPKKTGTQHFANDASMKEFNDVEAFYVQQISQKVELIDEFQRNEGLNGFTQDFKQLEAMYLVLKEEMKTHPSQKVKDALVLNLLVRIDLLNQQLHHLEKEEQPEPEKKEKSSNT
jgi:hypothetical protein